MALNIKIVLHKAEEGGYWVEVPALPGCVSQGESKKEALENIREAIGLHLRSLADYRPAASGGKKDEIRTVCIGA